MVADRDTRKGDQAIHAEQSPLTPVVVGAVVPCHDELPRRELLRAIREHVGMLVLVADGLPAAAADQLERLARETDSCLLRFPGNRGKGTALAAGIAELLSRPCPPRAVLLIDADGQHPPEGIPALLGAAAQAELVVGDRFGDLSSMPWPRRLANRAASGLLALRTGKTVRDSQCGMRLLRGAALHTIALPPGRYESETTHLKRCLEAGVAVTWVPIPALYEGAPSSFRPIRDLLRVLIALLR